MIIRKPQIKMIGEEGNKVPVIQKFEEKYTDEDLMLDYLEVFCLEDMKFPYQRLIFPEQIRKSLSLWIRLYVWLPLITWQEEASAVLVPN